MLEGSRETTLKRELDQLALGISYCLLEYNNIDIVFSLEQWSYAYFTDEESMCYFPILKLPIIARKLYESGTVK